MKYKQIIIGGAGAFLFVLSLINCFYMTLLFLAIKNFPISFADSVPQGFQDKQSMSLVAVVFAYGSSLLFFIVYFLRLFSVNFKKVCFEKPWFFLIAALFLILSLSLLINGLYRETFNTTHLQVPAANSTADKDFANSFNILRTGYPILASILSMVTLWSVIFLIAFIKNDYWIKLIARDLNHRDYKKASKKKK